MVLGRATVSVKVSKREFELESEPESLAGGRLAVRVESRPVTVNTRRQRDLLAPETPTALTLPVTRNIRVSESGGPGPRPGNSDSSRRRPGAGPGLRVGSEPESVRPYKFGPSGCQ